MSLNNSSQRAQWDSNLQYLLVTTGSVIGLGNIFQFPFFVSKYGPLFILVYLLFELFISIPILLAEFFIGRRSKQNPVGAFSILALESGASHYWRWIGWICFTILFLTFGYYSVNVAQPLSYSIHSLSSLLSGTPTFKAVLAAHPFSYLSYFIIFLILTLVVIARGINRGLESISRIVVPTFFIIFLGLAYYSSTIGDFKAALQYLVNFQTKLTPDLIFTALVFAFFKLNAAMGCMIVYGSYLPATTKLGKSTLIIAAFDLLASFLSYFIIFPIMFAKTHFSSTLSLDPQQLLTLFSEVPGGLTLAFLFFLGATMASWMPAIAFAEGATVTLIERGNLNRLAATIIIGLIALIIGALIIFSPPLFSGLTIKDIVHEIASDWLTPLSALSIAIFSGWIIRQDVAKTELNFSDPLFSFWRFLIRFIVPLCVIGVFIFLLGR